MPEPDTWERRRSVLICHADEPLNRYALSRWLSSFTELAAIVEIHEPAGRLEKRVRRELKRVGPLRFLDVLAFRLYYKAFIASKDRRWEDSLIESIQASYPDVPASTRVLVTSTPNSAEVQRVLNDIRPDIMLARCKTILKESIFTAPRVGTFVMHPGICPEYRNAHGCFWALASRDMGNVGMTLLRVDPGVDTGPVFGYYRANFDERRESHVVIQDRVVFDNLAALRDKLVEILEGEPRTISTGGRSSRAWGQPWLSAYLRWKLAAHRGARVPR